MQKVSILVTAISGDVANSILKCLLSYEHIDNLYGCDIYSYPCGINKVKEFFKVPICFEESKYLQEILRICKAKNIKLVIPTNEFEIACLSKNRTIFEKEGIILLIHDSLIYDYFFNKYNTQLLLKELNLPNIKTFYGDEYKGNLAFPIILKNNFSSGSKNIKKFNSEDELKRFGPLDHNQIVQPYIGSEDREYTVPVFSKDYGEKTYCVPFLRKLSKAGYTNFIEPVPKTTLHSISGICDKIAKKIRLKGCIDLQFREQNNEFYIFECNPRISGTSNFRNQLGFKDVHWWVSTALSISFDIDYIYTSNYVGVRELNEEIVWL